MSVAKTQDKKVELNLSLNAEELKAFMRVIIESNRHLQKRGVVPKALEIEGMAGNGKTSIVEQVAKEFDLKLKKVSLSNIQEVGDLLGFPIKEYEMCEPDTKEKPECKWIPEKVVEEYEKQGYIATGKSRMGYAPPTWVSDESGGLLLLDDYTRGEVRFLQATMDLIDRQEYISWKLPKDWHIMMTTNPDNGDYMVNVLDTAQKTRFVSKTLKWDVQCWARWAEERGVDSRCINFLLMNPEMVTEKANSRAITNFFDLISFFKDFEKSSGDIQMIGEGLVGHDFTMSFNLFITNRFDKLISPMVMVTEKEYDKVKKEMVECIGKPYRADIASVLATRIINYSLLLTKESTVSKAVIERLVKFSTDNDVLHSDLRFYIVKNLLGKAQKEFSEMMLNAEVQKMAMK